MIPQWKSFGFWQKEQNTMYPAQVAAVKEAIKVDLAAQVMEEFATVGPKMGDVFPCSKYSFPINVSLIARIVLTDELPTLKEHHLNQENWLIW